MFIERLGLAYPSASNWIVEATEDVGGVNCPGEPAVALIGTELNFSLLLKSLRAKRIEVSKQIDRGTRLLFLDLSIGKELAESRIRVARAASENLLIVGLATWLALSERSPALAVAVDDVIFYPCQPGELEFRLDRLLQKASKICEVKNPKVIEFAGFTFNAGEHAIAFKNASITLTKREFELMLFLAEKADQVIARSVIELEVWKHKTHLDSFDNVLNVHLTRLRRKLRELGCEALLVIDRGAGISLKRA
jgi:DNA-binding response OmpR family regulator